MAATDVAPATVDVSAEELSNPRFTPRELRLIQEHAGRSFSAIVGDADSDEKMVVIAWLKLRRDGYAITLADMDDVVIGFAIENPTNGKPPPTSPHSVVGGE